jgi:hypothetical protein
MNHLSTTSSESRARSDRPSPSPQTLTRLAKYSLLLFCTIGSALTMIGAAKIIPCRGDTTGTESVNPYVSILAVQTGHLYHPLSAPPYAPQAFGPLFYAAGAGIAWLSHLDIDETYRLGRATVVLSLLLCAVAVWLISWQLQFTNTVSALTAMTFLAQPFFARWSGTMRPDVPALLAMLLALLFAVRFQEMGIKSSLLAGSLIGLGFLVKQSAAAAGLSIALVYLFNGRYKQIVVLVLSAAAPVVIAFAFLSWRQEPFLDHFLAAGHTTWSLAGAGAWLAEGHLSRPTAILYYAIGTVGFLRAIKAGEQAQMLAAFAAVNVFAGFALIPQLGGAANYFLPGFAGCALLLPFAIRTFEENVRAPRAIAALVTLSFLAALLDCAAGFYVLPRSSAGRYIPYGLLSSFKVLSDDGYLEVHTRDPEIIDPFTIHSLELQGRWNPSGVVANVQTHAYDLVILGNGRVIKDYRGIAFFGPVILNALNENYEVLCGYGNGVVLKPRSREAAAGPEMLSRILGPCVAKPPEPNLVIRDSDR